LALDTLLKGHADGVNSAEFSPDGNRIVTASGDGDARVWNVSADGPWASIALKGHERAANSAEFSPDGNQTILSLFADFGRPTRELA